MATDTTRRSTLKAMALATGATMLPGLARAVCNHGASKQALTSTSIRGTGLIVSFGKKPGIDGSRQVIVTNTNDQPVTLSHIYPGIVSTPEGQYDLNSLLVNGSREFAAKHATTLNIKVAKHTQINAQINQLRNPREQSLRTAESFIHVRTTNAKINGGKPVTTVRQVLS